MVNYRATKAALLVTLLAACSALSVDIKFSKGLSIREANELVHTSGINVEYISFTQQVAGEETVGGTSVEDDLSDFENTWRESTQGFVADMTLTDNRGHSRVRAERTEANMSAPNITGVTGKVSRKSLPGLRSDKRVSELLVYPKIP